MEKNKKIALALLIVIITSTVLAFFISPASTPAPESSRPTSDTSV